MYVKEHPDNTGALSSIGLYLRQTGFGTTYGSVNIGTAGVNVNT